MTEPGLRLDKWLWHARFVRSRSRAADLCVSERLRVNGVTVRKAHHAVRPGDVLTFPQGHVIRVIRVIGLAERRGPASQMRALYEDLGPTLEDAGRHQREEGEASAAAAQRPAGSGRPTKKNRRAIDRCRDPLTWGAGRAMRT
jgi:ribosome-associated heat shock protein Hsp15